MIFTKVRKAVAIVLLFALLFSTFPMSALANDNPEETAATEETATVETTAAPTDGCLETEPATGLEPESTGEDEQDLMWVINPETGDLELVRGLHHRLIRSNTVTSGWGGIYARNGAGSVSFTYTRADGSSATWTLNKAGDNSGGETSYIGIVHYLHNSYTNDILSSVMSDPIAYCIDPVKPSANQQHYNSGSEYHYIMTNVLSPAKINAVKLACAYGWPYGFSDAYTTSEEVAFKRQFATQVIIWEIVMGLRGTSGTYAVTDNRLYDHYAGNPTPGWSYYGSTNDAYISAYQEISARLARHNTYPSFASSSASNAPVYAMTYSGGKYTYTLTDSNGVLSPDFSSFSAPSGVTVTKNGNTLTITATEAAMASGEVTVSMTGRKVNAGATYVWFAVNTDQEDQIYTSQQPLTSIDTTSSVPAYFKLKAETKTVSIKKTSSASASELACIQGNPLYTLKGAKYEIYVGTYPNGTLSETLTTDEYGNATGTVKYNIGTKLWAKEIVAPSGYLMPAEADNHYPLTVSSGSNVFEVTDDPTFDPQQLVIKKTGTDNTRIQGAVFKATFYARDWMDSTQLKRTWYFQSDANGYVYFDDSHLLSSYNGVNSDPLYRPDGTHVSLPLGCVYVEEVKAANGYILPTGNTGGVCIFIRQGGTKVAQNGKAAGAYWGNGAADPLSTTNPKGIYKIENDSQKQTVTAVNEEAYGAPFEVVKTDESNVKLEGAVFKVEYYNSSWCDANALEKTWYFKTDSNGYFTLDATHRLNNSEYHSDALFATGKIPLGIMAITEVKAPTGFVKANFTGLWRMMLSADNTEVKCLWAASNGYTPTTSYGDVAYVLDTDPDKLYVKNTSIPRTPISIKKTSNATASELACIQGNPLYSLAGAKYEIYEGTYPNGTLRETLTTDANGNATGTVTYYADGTVKLYAIETVAPAGYLLNSTPVALTVTTSNHVFNVSDVPTFDTNALKIKKTGSANEKIQGAVFKATFYASNWMDSTQRKRTWYFQSDENGIVKFDDTHLLSSYNGETSSALYKPNGSTAKFPLGCVYVEEVEAANGYILPTGGTGGVCIFIRQGGTKVIQNGKPAGAYWGDGAADPLSTTNPKGIYKIENDAQNQTVTAVNETAYGAPFKVVKTDESDVKLEGAVFKVEYYNSSWCNPNTLEKTWYFKTDSNGYFTLDAVHLLTTTAYPSDTLFPDGKIPLGLMTVKEVKAPTGFLLTNFTGYWSMRRASNQIDVECLWVTVDGYTPALGYGSLAYILDEEPDKLYVKNKPLELKIVKTSTDGKVNNIDFVVDIKNDANEWDNIGTFTTGTDGKIDVPKQYLIQGATYRITEIVPENYICTTQNPQTVTLNRATTTVNFSNKPFSGLEIIKTSPDGNIANIEFVIEKQVPLGHGEYTTWEILDPKNPSYFTNEKGEIVIDDDTVLETGMVLRITEHVPEGYICTSKNPKTITLAIGKNSVTFENIPVAKLSLVKRSDDGHVDGMQFKLEKKHMTEQGGLTGREKWDLIGTYTTHDGGVILPEEFGALDYDGIYRVTEIVPQGYICENPVQTFTAGIDSEGNPVTEHQVTFENRRIYGNLEITKVDESYPDHKLTGAEFTVTMTAFGSSEQKTKIMTEVLDEHGNGTGVYRLEGIEYGTICEIRETAAPEGYELSDETWTVTILEEKTYTIATPNFDAVINRQVEGQISVHKEDAEHNAMSGVQFLLEYSVDEGRNWAPVQARTAEDPILPGYCTSEGLTDGVLTTGADGNIVFTGLALSTELNSNVTYRLTEVKTLPGYSLLADPVFEGTLTSEEYDLAFTVVNHSTFKMPMTGSIGFVGATIGSILTVLASLVLALLFIRRRKAKL